MILFFSFYYFMFFFFFFFFSSRRRHTRLQGDWSSDVCSSDLHAITARFDPWGVFIRQWRFSEIHIESGEVEIQIYEANPEEVAPKPWFAFFLPNRVYIKRIQSEHANVTWQFRGERAGLFGTQLLITPYGRDFNYAAAGGKLEMALLPELYLHRANVLITKTLVTVSDID